MPRARPRGIRAVRPADSGNPGRSFASVLAGDVVAVVVDVVRSVVRVVGAALVVEADEVEVGVELDLRDRAVVEEHLDLVGALAVAVGLGVDDGAAARLGQGGLARRVEVGSDENLVVGVGAVVA